MSCNYDVIVVGSGPSGVSSAFPLVEAGLKVLLVDGGREIRSSPPSKPYPESCAEDINQWEWMLGRDFFALKNQDAVSPKLKVPAYSPIFEDFAAVNKIDARDFLAIGSLARGGLSNAWGCGVARLSSIEMGEFPFAEKDIEPCYARVTRRMGVSGAVSDDLSPYFGLDDWADPPLKMDGLHTRLLQRYENKKSTVAALGMHLGRSRVAVLGQNRGARKACDYTGNCLWGCYRHALYSSSYDLMQLNEFENFTYRPGAIVERVIQSQGHGAVEVRGASTNHQITARKIILAAGTLATTRLALQTIGLRKPIAMQSNPTAAYMLWLPATLGMPRESAFALGQLSFTLSLLNKISAFGSLFTTNGIPLAEFARHLPLSRRYGIDFLGRFLSSCVVGNVFLPGHLSEISLTLTADDRLLVQGGYRKEVEEVMRCAKQRLRKIFWKLGAVLLPKSFTLGQPGSDIHYACSLPMRKNPKLGETDTFGKLYGGDDVYIVDGASLSTLTEKSHTLTIMANADRIGGQLAKELTGAEK